MEVNRAACEVFYNASPAKMEREVPGITIKPDRWEERRAGHMAANPAADPALLGCMEVQIGAEGVGEVQEQLHTLG